MSDPREARAEVAAEKARQKALRPWYKKKRTWVLGVVGLIVVIVIAGSNSGEKTPVRSGDAASSSGNTSNPPAGDVTMATCEQGQFGPTVRVTITNRSSKRSNYLVSANLEDAAGNKVGEANGASNNVEPGQTATADLLASANGGFTRCVVKNVDRFASS